MDSRKFIHMVTFSPHASLASFSVKLHTGVGVKASTISKLHSFTSPAYLHHKLCFGAAYCKYISDATEREEYKKAFAEADIVLAEFGAYCINILGTDKKIRQQNIDEICNLCNKYKFSAYHCIRNMHNTNNYRISD